MNLSSDSNLNKSPPPALMGAEWWVHSRTHGSGHQLHYDMDEGRLRTSRGKDVRHPLVSTILYLSPGSTPFEQPTLVTTQRFRQLHKTSDTFKSISLLGNDDENESDYKENDGGGWLIYPAENRLCFFDGELLHGVVPGTPGQFSSSHEKTQVLEEDDEDEERKQISRTKRQCREDHTVSHISSDNGENFRNTSDVDAGAASATVHNAKSKPHDAAHGQGRRTTLMIGWWVKKPVTSPPATLGPNMTVPLPSAMETSSPEYDAEIDTDIILHPDVLCEQSGDIGNEVRSKEASRVSPVTRTSLKYTASILEASSGTEENTPKWVTEMKPSKCVLEEDALYCESKHTIDKTQQSDSADSGKSHLMNLLRMKWAVPATVRVNNVWTSVTSAKSDSAQLIVPYFPSRDNRVMFFGRIFLHSLSQVDEEIAAAYNMDCEVDE